jgi:hypothetical protein
MNRRYPRKKHQCTLVHYAEGQTKLAPLDEPTVHILVASDDWNEQKLQKIVAPDDPTV